MLRLLNEVSPWLLALGIVAIAEAYSIGLMLLCRKQWGTDRLALNNEVAASNSRWSGSSMRCCSPSW